MSCSRCFPNECEDCSEYEETYPSLGATAMGYFGMSFGPSYLVKKCRRFGWKSYEQIAQK